MAFSYLVTPGKKFKLSKVDPSDSGKFKSKEEAAPAIEENLKQLDELQEVLYAQGKHSVLIVLQALDAAGKDGAIDHLFSGINPQGCQVTSFKVPTSHELARDYLWRYHAAVPPRGMIGIFNRSHYEAVLVERVKKIASPAEIKKRYEHINAWEKMLADEGATIMKFYLHISKEEQRERLQARLDDPHKNWKFEPGDLDTRKQWDEYQEAYQDAICNCSTDYAPWYVIPADRKWFRNWAISEIIVRTLKNLKLEFPKPKVDVSQYKVL